MENRYVPALYRAMKILDALESHGCMSAQELIKETGLAKSTVYTLLDDMVALKLISKDSHGKYHLWLKLISLGNAASKEMDIRDACRDDLRILVEQVGLLGHLGIMVDQSAYYILKIESSSTISVKTYEGKQLTLHRSAVGKCLLAYQPKGIQELIAQDLEYEAVTPTSIVDKTQLLSELQEIRARGWAYDNGEDVEDVCCIASPVRGIGGQVLGAISLVGTRLDLSGDIVEVRAKQLQECTDRISHKLGYSG